MLKRLFGRGRGATALDPVCGMRVDKDDPPGGSFKHGYVTYYFCGDRCREVFSKDPVSFIEAAAAAGAPIDMTSDGSSADASPTAPISFTATDDPSGDGEFVDVAYVCVCGCRPGARVVTGSGESASEHCCCGRVHFAGEGAERALREYMTERAKTDMDADVAPYVYSEAEAVSASGVSVGVAYAQPERPRK
jgi:YHS domain-containing protein